MKQLYVPSLLVVALTLMSSTKLPDVGTEETVGAVNGVTIVAKVQGPSAQETPLQIACLFEYVEGDIYTSPPALPKDSNGMVHLDSALHGLITDIRRTNKFKGKFLETLLITPPPNTIPAKKLLLIGLGSQKSFTPDMMRLVGLVGMREALRLGVTKYSHASDLKDAGYSSPTAQIAGDVVQGALEAYSTQQYLKQQNASDPLTVTEVTLLAGQAYFEDSKTGIKKVIENGVKTEEKQK